MIVALVAPSTQLSGMAWGGDRGGRWVVLIPYQSRRGGWVVIGLMVTLGELVMVFALLHVAGHIHGVG